MPLRIKTELVLIAVTAVVRGREREREFRLKVAPRLGGPTICPGPYAPAYPDATPLNWCQCKNSLHYATLEFSFEKKLYV